MIVRTPPLPPADSVLFDMGQHFPPDSPETDGRYWNHLGRAESANTWTTIVSNRPGNNEVPIPVDGDCWSELIILGGGVDQEFVSCWEFLSLWRMKGAERSDGEHEG